MVTMIAVAAILGVGLYAHHARWKTQVVLLVCSAILALGFGLDLVIEPPPSRFDIK